MNNFLTLLVPSMAPQLQHILTMKQAQDNMKELEKFRISSRLLDDLTKNTKEKRK